MAASLTAGCLPPVSRHPDCSCVVISSVVGAASIAALLLAGLQGALDLLDPIKQKYPDVSYADLFQLASAVAIEVRNQQVDKLLWSQDLVSACPHMHAAQVRGSLMTAVSFRAELPACNSNQCPWLGRKHTCVQLQPVLCASRWLAAPRSPCVWVVSMWLPLSSVLLKATCQQQDTHSQTAVGPQLSTCGVYFSAWD